VPYNETVTDDQRLILHCAVQRDSNRRSAVNITLCRTRQ